MRKDLGLSQAQLARRMDVKPSYVSGVERGKENLSLGALARIADAFGTGLAVAFPAVRNDSATLHEDLRTLREERERTAARQSAGV